jgi:beta-N-acetylhexosaminidase
MFRISFVSVILLIIFSFNGLNKDMLKNKGITYPDMFHLTSSDKAWVENTLEEMTLEEKCAQLIFPDANSNMFKKDTAGKSRLEYLVRDMKVGGVVFFEGDIYNQAAFTNHLQLLAETPLLIASDFERGLGMRLRDAVEYPYNMAIAATREPHFAYLMGLFTARESRAIGVHQNYAPVVDINHDYRNPIVNIRAYSDNTELISEFTDAFIKGMKDGNMLTTAKHFPGHGATSLDSHREMPKIMLSKEEFNDADLVPFKKAINDGVTSIMVGHLGVPAYEEDPKTPASVSKNIISGLLVKELGFKGLIVSDAMNMHAITKNFDTKTATIQCIKAGTDILIYPDDPIVSVDALIEAVKNKEIPLSRIERSVRKILSAKKSLKLDEDRFINIGNIDKVVSLNEPRRLAEEIAQRSITLVKDDKNIVPLNLKDYKKIACITLRDTRAKLTEKNITTFEKLVSSEFEDIQLGRLSRKSDDKEYEKMFKLAQKSDYVILPTFVDVRSFQGTVDIDSRHQNFINRLIELNKPLVVLGFGNPYILNKFSKVPAYLTSYGGVTYSQKAMFDALFGRTVISGTLPITIPETEYKFGDGLHRFPLELKSPEKGNDKNYNFKEVDSLMNWAVKDSIFPGGVLVVGHKGKIVYEKAFGNFTYDKNSEKVTTSTIYDLASLSKVVGTTPAVMMLVQQGKLSLEDKVCKYLPNFVSNGKDKILIKNLMLHNSGLPPFINFFEKCKTKEEAYTEIDNLVLSYDTGTKVVYSDLSMIVMQRIIEKVSGESLDKFLKLNLFDVLGMKNTMYNPAKKIKNLIAPTELDKSYRNKLIQGEVHDENAFFFGGVSGHAGIFSCGHDLAIYVQTLLNGGWFANKKIFDENLINNWTDKAYTKSERGYGWDIKGGNKPSCGNKFSDNSFGHTGFTGTSIWVDKEKQLFVILLSNRVYPSRNNNKHIRFRPLIHTKVVEALD